MLTKCFYTVKMDDYYEHNLLLQFYSLVSKYEIDPKFFVTLNEASNTTVEISDRSNSSRLNSGNLANLIEIWWTTFP